jgi:tetratricopeptide (TPR) repeat protein
MDNTSAAGATPPAAPVSYPVFAAVAVGITGRTVYDVIDLVGGIFEGANAVFEGSPDAPGTLIALLPPSDAAASQAVQLGLQAQVTAPTLRLGVDATEVHSKKEQDAKWQHVIDSVVRLQKAARTGEAIAGEGIDQLTHGGAATEALQVGDRTYRLLTGVRELAAVPTEPMAQPPQAIERTVEATEPQLFLEPEPERVQEIAPAPVLMAPEPVAMPTMHPTARWDGALTGREMQLADLRARFDRVIAERTAACVLITGESGSGRTRLVRELAGSLEGARVLTVGCAPADGGGARWPLAAIVEAVTGLDALAPAEPARARLAELFAGHADGERVVPQLAAMLALEGAIETDRVRWALRRLFEVAHDGTPTLLHIDDADRAGAGFLRLLADVATAIRDTTLLFAITTTRESDAIPAVRLGPLGAGDAAALITGLLGTVEPGVETAIAARVSTTPFAIEQGLALLTESGTLAPGQGRWMPLADLTHVPFPDTMIGSIRQRLQMLPAHELAVLGMAAVAGERFATEPLLDVVPAEARSGVPRYLGDLVARGYLVADGSDALRFRHPLLRDATMQGVPDWAQATTHERFGRHLEQVAGRRLWRFADVIGDHLEASTRLRPDAPSDDRTDALDLLAWSAAAAIDQGDFDGAARLERRAATLVDDDPVHRAELLYLAAEHGALAAPDRSADREIAEAALAASVVGDDVDWRVRLLRARLRTTARHEDALEGARATADEAIAVFPEDELSWALSSAWALRGMVHAGRAQNGMVADDLQTAADNAAAVHRWYEETAALRVAADALLDGPVSVDEAEARCASFLDRVRGPLAEHDIRGTIAVLRARRSAFDQARRDIVGSVAALEELGAAGDLAVALHRAAQIEVLSGQSHAAEPQMQRALAAATHSRDDALRANLAASFAQVLVADEDRLDEALALADVAEAHAGDMTTQVGWRMARARVMVRRGRAAHAERLAREGLGIAEQTDSTDLRANALLWAADVRRQAGRPAEAEPFERRALRLFERRGATAQASVVAAALAPPAPEPPPGQGAPVATPSAEPDAPGAEKPVSAADPTDAPSDTAPTSQPVADPPAGEATRLADEMIAMFAADRPLDEPVAEQPAEEIPGHAERPIAEIDPADELLEDPTHSAQEESHRRWFNR